MVVSRTVAELTTVIVPPAQDSPRFVLESAGEVTTSCDRRRTSQARDLYRTVAPFSRTIAELTALVRAPASHGPVVVSRTGVCIASRELDRIDTFAQVPKLEKAIIGAGQAKTAVAMIARAAPISQLT